MNIKTIASYVTSFLVFSCYGMNNPNNDMSNAKVCKEQFLNWWQNTPIATEQHWERMRKGLEAEGGAGISLVPVKQYSDSKVIRYIAYSCPVEIENKKSIFMYPWSACSPNVKTKLDDVCPGLKVAYCLAPKNSPALESIGWEKVDSLPESLEPKYFGLYDKAEIVPYKVKLKLWGQKAIGRDQVGKEIEGEEDLINWDVAREQFSATWGNTFVGTPERWYCMQQGFSGYETQVTLIPSNPIVTPLGQNYLVGSPTTQYLAYSRPQEVDGELATFIYPSSLNDFASALQNLCPSIKKAYSLAPKQFVPYIKYGWVEIETLPQAVKPEYFGKYNPQEIVPYLIKLDICKKVMALAKTPPSSAPKEEAKSSGYCIIH